MCMCIAFDKLGRSEQEGDFFAGLAVFAIELVVSEGQLMAHVGSHPRFRSQFRNKLLHTEHQEA